MKTSNCIFGVFVAAMTLSFSAASQIVQSGRIEFSSEDNIDFKVAPADETGIFLFRQIENTYKNATDDLWEVILIDTALNIRWRREQALRPGTKLMSHFYDGYTLHLLFTNEKSKSHNLLLVSFPSSGEAAERHSIRNFIPFAFKEFKVLDPVLLIGGYFNYRTVVILYNLESNIPKVLPGLFNEKTELIEIKLNGNATFDIIVKAMTVEKNSTLFIYTFDWQANLVKQIALDVDKSKELLFGRSEKLEGGAQLVAGVYGKRKSAYSRGVFIANINRYGEQKIQFYNYADLKNFFQYMKAKREQRIAKRIERRKIKNKKIRFNYRLLVHDLIRYDDQYILLGEAFYPKYRSADGSSPFFGTGWIVNRGVYQSSLIFDGYRYTHAVIIGFDKAGNLLWDNSFEINDVISFKLEQFVHVSTNDEGIILLYVFDNAIRSKIIRGSEVLEGKEKSEIQLLHQSDEAIKGSTKVGGLHQWYDNTFFVYGIQEIRNSGSSDIPGLRQVFFVNKLMPE